MAAGSNVLDTTRNITWHMGTPVTFTIAPSSAADVDRTCVMLSHVRLHTCMSGCHSNALPPQCMSLCAALPLAGS